MAFDPNTVTMREMREIQRHTDGPDDQAGQATATAWIAKRREDPTYTFDQALDLTLAEVTEILSGDAVPFEKKK